MVSPTSNAVSTIINDGIELAPTVEKRKLEQPAACNEYDALYAL